MKYLRLLLLPFSLVFFLIVFIRNKFFDWGILKSEKLNVPVVSIGNIIAGGSGKTPFTIYLSKFFLKKNLKVAVISKGYKRISDSDIELIEGKSNAADIEKIGDEPYLIFSKLKGVSNNFILASGKSKLRSAKLIAEKYKPDVIIIDDGFQHRKLSRDLDIVLTGRIEQFENRLLIPSGNLRETKSAFKRASFVIYNNKSDLFEPKHEICFSYISKGYYNIEGEEVKLDNAVYTLSAIANPHSFYSLINRDKLNILRKFEFPDHHSYNTSDLMKKFTGIDKGKTIVTTEKDFVKLKNFPELFKEYKIVFLKMEIVFNKGEKILQNKLNTLQ